MNKKSVSKKTDPIAEVRQELKSDVKTIEIVFRTELRSAIGKQNEYIDGRFEQQDASIARQFAEQTETLTRAIEGIVETMRENHPTREEFEELKSKIHQ